MAQENLRSLGKYLLLVLALAAANVGAARIGLALTYTEGNVTLFWPPTGISIAALLLGGLRLCPAVWLGSFIANLSIGNPLLVSGFMGVGSLLEAVIAVLLLRKVAGFRPDFERPIDAFTFVLYAAGLGPAVSATVGVISLFATSGETLASFAPTWATWWMGNAAGALVLAPAILTCWPKRMPRLKMTRRTFEAIFVHSCGALSSFTAFGVPVALGSTSYPLAFLPFPFLVWAALRFGAAGAMVASLGISGVAAWGTVNGGGPFTQEDPTAAFLLVWAYMVTVGLTALLTTAILSGRERVVRALRKTQSNLAEAQRIARLGNWEMDIVTGEVEQSAEYTRLFGRPYDDPLVLIDYYKQIIHPDDIESFQTALREHLQYQKQFDLEYRIVRPDGEVRVIHDRSETRFDKAGRAVHAFGVAQDITERKHREEEREESAKTRELISEVSSNLAAVSPEETEAHVKDSLHRIGAFTKADRCWLEIRDPETLELIEGFELAASGIPEAPVSSTDVPPQEFTWSLKKLSETGSLAIPKVSELPPEAAVERQLMEAQGIQSALIVRILVSFREETLVGYLGLDAVQSEREWTEDTIYLLTVAGDVIVGALCRSRTEQEVRRSEARLVEAQRIAKIGHWEWNLAANRLIWASEVYTMLGLTLESFDGSMESFIEFIVEEDREHFIRETGSFAQSGDPNVVEWRVLRPDGEVVHLYAQGERVVGPAGEVTLVGTVQDVTERKRFEAERQDLEAQVQHAQKLESLGVLAGGIAHDFNNLLLGIIGNAELARENVAPNSENAAYLENVVKSSEQAADLCKQLLAYSGKGKFVVETIDLSQLLEECSDLLSLSVSKKACLRYELDEHIPAIEADPTQIRQILMNIVMNASDALEEENGDIVVRTGVIECDSHYWSTTYFDDGLPEGAYAYLEVSDSGEGMDEATQKRIFDPFFTSKSTGRGLGLAAVVGIIRSHRGAIRVQSEPGKGTTIRVLFPASQKSPDTISVGAEYDRSWRTEGTVLVVDDDHVIRTFCKATLETAGLNVVTANDGHEAVQVYRRRAVEIDLVLLDLTMPRMNGIETLEELLKIDENVRVILSSGYSEQDTSERFDRDGYLAFIQKPYRPKELLQLVRQTLEAQPGHSS